MSKHPVHTESQRRQRRALSPTRCLVAATWRASQSARYLPAYCLLRALCVTMAMLLCLYAGLLSQGGQGCTIEATGCVCHSISVRGGGAAKSGGWVCLLVCKNARSLALSFSWHHVMSWPPKEFEESEAAKQVGVLLAHPPKPLSALLTQRVHTLFPFPAC